MDAIEWLSFTYEYVNAHDWPGEPCWNCGEHTTLLELNFEARLCSDECAKEKYKEYYDALFSGVPEEDIPAPLLIEERS